MRIDIIKNVKLTSAVSLIIIIAGLAVAAFSGFNLGIDFTGGTLIQLDLGEKKSVEEIRTITDAIDKSASIVHAGDDQSQVIIKTAKSLDNEQRTELFSAFKEKFNLEDSALIDQQRFEPTIGGEMKAKSAISVIVATICMLIYISFRFELNFGIAAIIALIHDVLIGVAFYSIFRIPINTSFIVAMLTIVGYSINDTIVVFDRIRENIKLMRKESFETIVNASVNQTVKRSINTSFTTLLAIGSLYIFGVNSIRDFALPLMIGVIAGTYSSIFIASPIWYFLTKRHGDINFYNPNKLKK